jgi:hypothetical protein
MATLPHTQGLEAAFAPTNRFRDILAESGRPPLPDDFEEVEFTGYNLKELLASRKTTTPSVAATWEGFHAFVGNRRIIWTSSGACVVGHAHTPIQDLDSLLEPFIVSQEKTDLKLIVFAWSSTQAASTCDFLLGLLAQSKQPDTRLWSASNKGDNERMLLPLSADALASFLERSNANLSLLTLEKVTLSKNHFQAMAAAPGRPRLDLYLKSCTVSKKDSNAFLDCVQHHRGPTSLVNCVIGVNALAEALRTSTHLKRLTPRQLGNHGFRMLTRALTGNQSLEKLDMSCFNMLLDSDWISLCDSVQLHPNLKMLHFGHYDCWIPDGSRTAISGEDIELRMHAVTNMLHWNTVLEELGLPYGISIDCHKSIRPRLEMNRDGFTVQCQAIKSAPVALRPQLLLGAVTRVRFNPTLVWKFLSQNVDVVAAAKNDDLNWNC